MSNNTAFGTAAPSKRLAGADAPSSAGKKEGSSAPVDPEWEAARCARLTCPCLLLSALLVNTCCLRQLTICLQPLSMCTATPLLPALITPRQGATEVMKR